MEHLYCRFCGIESGEMGDDYFTVRQACGCDAGESDEDYSPADARLWHALRALYTCRSWASEARDDAVSFREYLYAKIRTMAEEERETVSQSFIKDVQRAEGEVLRLEAELAVIQQKEAARQAAP